MAKAQYAVVGGTTKKIKKKYAVIDGKTRKIKKEYVVVDGKTRLCFSGSGIYAIPGYNGSMTSDDGVSWNAHPGSITYGFELSAFGNGIFVIGKYRSGQVTIYYSKTGSTWTASATLSNGYSSGHSGGINLSFCNNHFILVNDCNVYTSTDAITWTLVKTYDKMFGDYIKSNIGYGLYNGSYYYVCNTFNYFGDYNGDELIISKDLKNWTYIVDDGNYNTGISGGKTYIFSNNNTLYWLYNDGSRIYLYRLNTSTSDVNQLSSLDVYDNSSGLDYCCYDPDHQYIMLTCNYGQKYYVSISSYYSSFTSYGDSSQSSIVVPVAYHKGKYFSITNDGMGEEKLWYTTSFDAVKNGTWTLSYTGSTSDINMGYSNCVMYVE